MKRIRGNALILASILVLAYGVGCADTRALNTFREGIARQKAGTTVMIFDANGDGKNDFRLEDTDGDKLLDNYQWDTDFDGKYDLTRTRAEIASSALSVVICLDGVPFKLVREMWDDGHFRDFNRPGIVLAAFPSVTELALTRFYDASPYMGYEDRFYNRLNNRIEGGSFTFVVGSDYYRDTFYDKMDYYTGAFDSGNVYLCTEYIANNDFSKLRKTLFSKGPMTRRIKGTPFIDLEDLYGKGEQLRLCDVYYLSSDAIGHKLGLDAVKKDMEKIEGLAREIIYRTRGRVNVVLFSDHGMDNVRPHRLVYHPALKKAGLRKGNSLGPEVDIVVPTYGMISFMAIYTRPALKKKVAETFGMVEGVQVAAYRGPDGFPIVVNSDGRAEIRYDKKMTRFKYMVVKGDPLKLKAIAAEFKQLGLMDPLGYVAREHWRQATVNHEFVDPLRRIAVAVTDKRLIINRADVLVALKSGYFFGSRFFEFMQPELKGTHGNLSPATSQGFVMHTGGRPKYTMDHAELARWLKTVHKSKK